MCPGVAVVTDTGDAGETIDGVEEWASPERSSGDLCEASV